MVRLHLRLELGLGLALESVEKQTKCWLLIILLSVTNQVVKDCQKDSRVAS